MLHELSQLTTTFSGLLEIKRRVLVKICDWNVFQGWREGSDFNGSPSWMSLSLMWSHRQPHDSSVVQTHNFLLWKKKTALWKTLTQALKTMIGCGTRSSQCFWLTWFNTLSERELWGSNLLNHFKHNSTVENVRPQWIIYWCWSRSQIKFWSKSVISNFN